MPPINSDSSSTTASSSLVQTHNQVYGCFDHRSPIYQKIVTSPYSNQSSKVNSRRNSITQIKTPAKILHPDADRVLNEYRLIERGMRSMRDVNSITLAGAREVIPRITKEQEKSEFDLCNLAQGEVAYKDL